MVPPRFWIDFLRASWNRKPAVLRQPFAAPMASAQALLGHIARACRERALLGDSARIYVENALVVTDRHALLPRPEDSDPRRYAQRVGAVLAGRRFGLVFNDYHRWDADSWLRTRDFVHGLFERTGLPAGGVDTGVFFGTYDRTPFGVHKDTKHIFTWVIEGTKRM